MPFAVSGCVLFLLTIRPRLMPSADNVLIESIRGSVYVLNAKGQTKKAEVFANLPTRRRWRACPASTCSGGSCDLRRRACEPPVDRVNGQPRLIEDRRVTISTASISRPGETVFTCNAGRQMWTSAAHRNFPYARGSPHPAPLCESTTAIAAMSTISFTSKARCNTCTGLDSPTRIGPMASRPPKR